MKPVYREGTTLTDIIKDGWSRGFQRNQTVQEALSMGYYILPNQVSEEWAKLDNDMFKELNEVHE